MKTLCLMTFALAIVWGAEEASCSPALVDFPEQELDLDQNGQSDMVYSRWIIQLGGGPIGGGGFATSYDIGFGAMAQGASRLVRSSAANLTFSEGQTVSATNAVFVNVGGLSEFPLMHYFKTFLAGEPTAICTYDNSITTWNTRLEGILGLHIQGDDGIHCGWVRFTRPDLEPSTPFVITGYDWNPVVGAPIEAGLPPSPPPLQAQFTDAGLNLLWDSRFTGLVLEWTDTVGQSDWQPVPAASTPPVTVRPDNAQRFFRLRRP